MTSPARIGVVVPCRDESRVLERKIANLSRLRWPDGGPHFVVVVDDGSADGGAELARRALSDRFASTDVRTDVLSNDDRAGKSGAIRTALRRLAGEVDRIVLTDADVVLREDALVAISRAFDEHEGLLLACGAQEFVRDLASDGTCRGLDLGRPLPAGGRYDRVTAAVRELEAHFGRTFSVHGQLLAWPVDAGLSPASGFAADDLDLMFAARQRGGRVRIVPAARFLEVKTPRGRTADEQTRRHAEGYFQVVDHAARQHRWPLGTSVLDRLQWSFYRYAPAWTPWLVLSGAVAVLLAAWLAGGGLALVFAMLLIAGGIASASGRSLLRLMRVIVSARRARTLERLSDRWDMERGDMQREMQRP